MMFHIFHYTFSVVSRRLRAIKMPRIMYPESEDSETEKFTRYFISIFWWIYVVVTYMIKLTVYYCRRRRPVRVFFKDEERVRRVASTKHSGVSSRQLRPLRPNNYMEESDKPLQKTECRMLYLISYSLFRIENKIRRFLLISIN